jgi:hypothetical protein
MSTFQVPQFVDQKPKIIGSLNMVQFGYIAVAGLIIFGLYYVFNLFVWIIVALPIAGVAGFLAFAKINGQESHKILGSMLSFVGGSKTYVWQRPSPKVVDPVAQTSIEKARHSMSIQEKIKSIALHVTTGNAFAKGKTAPEEPGIVREKPGFEVATFETGEEKLVKRVDY